MIEGGSALMSTVEKGIEVGVPVQTAYNQWTQFESFPEFMEGVKEVKQIDDKRLHWSAEVAGRDTEWDAEITEQIPDERIAWKSVSGQPNSGVVTFHRLTEGTCKVMLQLESEPQGLTQTVGDKLGFLDGQVERDLKRFKEYIESQGVETGGYRGEIRGDQVQDG
jgi:uncharacterized membrane protein